jgi:hypothetical protein
MSGISSGFIQQYIVDSSNWHRVQRLDKFTNSYLSHKNNTPPEDIQPTQWSRLGMLSKMQHSERPNWSVAPVHIFHHVCYMPHTVIRCRCCVLALVYASDFFLSVRSVEGRISVFTF